MPIVDGPVFQLAWVVDDIDVAEQQLTARMGVPKWMRIPDVHFGPDTCTFRGSPGDFTAHISLAYAGDLQLELIEPVSGDSIYSEHLTAHGEGLHHVAYLVDDLDAAINDAATEGLHVAQQGSFPGDSIRFAYLEGGAIGASYLELAQVSADMLTFFNSLKGDGPSQP